MTSSELDRLRRKHQQFIDEQQDNQVDDPNGNFADLLSEITLAGARRIDPEASQRATLAARLSGERVRSGAIDSQTLADVVTPLGIEVASASPGKSAPRLELVGLGAGSAVLHFEPVVGELDGEDAGRRTRRVDGAVNRVLDAHTWIEQNGNVSELSDRYGDMLDGLGKLTAALSKHEVELELAWKNSDGKQRRTVLLGQRGLVYARRIFERIEETDDVEVDGFVYGLSYSGDLTLKRDIARPRSRTFHVVVEPTHVGTLGFGLGDHVVISVERRTVKDLTGRERSPTTYTFRDVSRVQRHRSPTSDSPADGPSRE